MIWMILLIGWPIVGLLMFFLFYILLYRGVSYDPELSYHIFFLLGCFIVLGYASVIPCIMVVLKEYKGGLEDKFGRWLHKIANLKKKGDKE